MTGIERLRDLATDYISRSWSSAGKMRGRLMLGIADQIERERACDADTIENIRLIVGGVIDDMERHVSGVEGADDSPVARWARELREALGGEGRDLTDDDREAAAWVRKHGGLEKIIQQRRGSVPRVSFERKLGKRLRHIAECEEALRRRNATISALEKAADSLRKQIAEMLPRLMPEGMEWLVESWPRFEDGKPVRIGDVVSDVEVRSVVFRDDGILLSDCTSVPGWGTWRSYKEPIKRPAPKVSDADGAEIRVGDTVYQMGCKYRVSHLHGANGKVRIVYENSGRWVDPKTLTHRAPVLAADGRPLREGETVWDVESGTEYEVVGIHTDEDSPVRVMRTDGSHLAKAAKPSTLTHERPDSWERLEEDVSAIIDRDFECTGAMQDYVDERGVKCPHGILYLGVMQDVLRRAKKLAERGA